MWHDHRPDAGADADGSRLRGPHRADGRVETDPEAGWVFLVDNLNTHQSESLVQSVAQTCGIEADLGVKGKRGVLKSQKSRAAFLSDPDHRIRFVDTPKHTSWLNQVEIWFSILVRKLLRRSSFCSVEDLRARILSFIDYFTSIEPWPSPSAGSTRWSRGQRPGPDRVFCRLVLGDEPYQSETVPKAPASRIGDIENVGSLVASCICVLS